MWCDNHKYLLRLWICDLGRNETMVRRHAEGSLCSWTSFAFWLRHWNPEGRRRGKRWYRDVSGGDASTAWKRIRIFCKILSFLLHSDQVNCSPQISFGTIFYPSVSGYVDELIEALIEKKAPFVSGSCFVYNIFYDSSLFCQILSHASPLAKISEQQIEKVKSSGLGKLTTWSPQQFILNHPVLYPCFHLFWLNTYNKISSTGNRMVRFPQWF